MGAVEFSTPQVAEQALATLLEVWLKRGLLEFWRSALPEDACVVPLLRAGVQRLDASALDLPWAQLCERIAALPRRLDACDCTLLRLYADYKLSPSDLFLLVLLGHLQTDHGVHLAISELQLPDKTPQLSVHLASALLETLFPQECTRQRFIYGLLDNGLVRDALIQLSAPTSLVMGRLTLAPAVWALLNGYRPAWPGCRFLSAEEAGGLSEASRREMEALAAMLDRAEAPHDQSGAELFQPVVCVRGVPGSGRRAFCHQLAWSLRLKAPVVPENIWREQPALAHMCRYARWLPVIEPMPAPGLSFRLPEFRRSTPTAFVLSMDICVDGDRVIDIQMRPPTYAERFSTWNEQVPDELARRLAHTAMLNLNTIRRIGSNAAQLAVRQKQTVCQAQVLAARRLLSSEKLRLNAEPVEKQVQREAMAFSASVTQGLDLLLKRARKREALWEMAGKTLKISPSTGVRALFTGESGTGKTLAASYIATELSAPLYRVDLSAVMNKYIGESEKNLAQLLDYAAAGDVVLLFDEADALFGSRSEGKETGERFANMLTNFLLTRIENHPGIVILTTNRKERIDQAFNRRIDVDIDFPVPGFEERLCLWRGHLGAGALNDTQLTTLASYCDFAGGQVRNAVLTAVTCAEGESAGIRELLVGLRLEYAKLGRKLPVPIERLAGKQED